MKTKQLKWLNAKLGIAQFVVALSVPMVMAVSFYLHAKYNLELKTRKEVGVWLASLTSACVLFAMGRMFVRLELKKRDEQCGSVIASLIVVLVAAAVACLFFALSRPSA